MQQAHWPVPAEFAGRTAEVYGAAGTAWLGGLPALLRECAERWSLVVSEPFQPLSYNYVAPAAGPDGRALVLKLGVPNPELSSEIAALRRFDGRGAVRLVHADPERGALLIERVDPGTSLLDLSDDAAATSIAAGVMRRLWRPAGTDDQFVTTGDWGRGFERVRTRFECGSGPLPEALVDRAERLFAELLASSGEAVLLHGDLHHGNILRAGDDSWLAIDPKGVIGEAAYEPGAFLRNPLPELLEVPHPRKVLEGRIRRFAEELGLDAARIHGWALAQAVLSAWWMVEDHGGGWEPVIALAELLTEVQG